MTKTEADIIKYFDVFNIDISWTIPGMEKDVRKQVYTECALLDIYNIDGYKQQGLPLDGEHIGGISKLIVKMNGVRCLAQGLSMNIHMSQMDTIYLLPYTSTYFVGILRQTLSLASNVRINQINYWIVVKDTMALMMTGIFGYDLSIYDIKSNNRCLREILEFTLSLGHASVFSSVTYNAISKNQSIITAWHNHALKMTAQNMARCTYTVLNYPRSMLDYKSLALQPIHDFHTFDDIITCDGSYCFRGFPWKRSSYPNPIKHSSWNEREAFCQARGAHLLSVNTKTESTYILHKYGIPNFRIMPLVSIIFISLEKVNVRPNN